MLLAPDDHIEQTFTLTQLNLAEGEGKTKQNVRQEWHDSRWAGCAHCNTPYCFLYPDIRSCYHYLISSALYTKTASERAAMTLCQLFEFVFPYVISSCIDGYARILLWVTLFCAVGIAVLFTTISLICRYKLGKLKV